MASFDTLDEFINTFLKQNPQILLIVKIHGIATASILLVTSLGRFEILILICIVAFVRQEDGDIFEKDAVIGLSMSTDVG